MNVFYSPSLSASDMDEQEIKHCVRVLRMQLGDKLRLIDGKGSWAECRITNNDSKTFALEVENTGRVEQTSQLHLAISPPKNKDRWEFFIEKAVELGVAEITPLLCQQSERRVLKIDRSFKRAISALKQSGNLYLPRINELTPIDTFIENYKDSTAQRYIAYTPKRAESVITDFGKASIVAIGPEGGFTQSEIQLAESLGFKRIGLGQSKLRTETAGIYVASLFRT